MQDNPAIPVSADRFDIPLLLPIGFWTSLSGVFLERTHVLMSMIKAGTPLSTPLNYIIYSFGSLLLNFGSIFSLILAVYYFINAFKRKKAVGIVNHAIAFLCASAAATVAGAGLITNASVGIFLSAQLAALAACILLLIASGGESKGRIKVILLLLPVLSFLLLQINQVGFFFPHILPSSETVDTAAVFLFTGQIIFLIFAGLTAFVAIRWNRKHGLPLFVPFLVAISVLFVSVISIIGSERARLLFFRIIEVQYILPYSYIIYPLIFSLISFSFALLLTGDSKSRSVQNIRSRAAYALGFITVGTFTPGTYNEIAFLILGMSLWLMTLPKLKDA
ncbi:MAG: hypothetical protein ABIJ56_24260 [Pseudomonadota bacterium]